MRVVLFRSGELVPWVGLKERHDDRQLWKRKRERERERARKNVDRPDNVVNDAS